MRKSIMLIILSFCLIVALSLSLMACDLLGGGGNDLKPDNGSENVENGGSSSDKDDGPTKGEVKDLVLNSIQSMIDLHQDSNYSLTVSMNGALNKGSFDVVCDGLTYHSFLKENDDFIDAYFTYTSEIGIKESSFMPREQIPTARTDTLNAQTRTPIPPRSFSL